MTTTYGVQCALANLYNMLISPKMCHDRHHQANSDLLDGDATVGAHLALETGDLAGGELVHTTIIAVVHVVVCFGVSNKFMGYIGINSRMGSTPDDEQVSRPVGHPLAGEASAGVSET